MAKESRCEVQKGPIEPHDFMSDNNKNLTPLQRAEMDYSNRMMRRDGQQMEYSPIKHK